MIRSYPLCHKARGRERGRVPAVVQDGGEKSLTDCRDRRGGGHSLRPRQGKTRTSKARPSQDPLVWKERPEPERTFWGHLRQTSVSHTGWAASLGVKGRPSRHRPAEGPEGRPGEGQVRLEQQAAARMAARSVQVIASLRRASKRKSGLCFCLQHDKGAGRGKSLFRKSSQTSAAIHTGR